MSLLGKGLAIGSAAYPVYNNSDTALGEKATLLAIVFATQFLPGLLLGIFLCWHKDIPKTIVAHPSIILMPAFTGFTFRKEKENIKETEKPEYSDRKTEEQENPKREKEELFIVFSTKFTVLNSLLSILSIVVHGQGIAQNHEPPYILSLILRIVGLLLTLLSLPLVSRQPRCRTLAKHILANIIFNAIAYPIFIVAISMAGPSQSFLSLHLYYVPFPMLGLLLSIIKVIIVSCRIQIQISEKCCIVMF